MDYASQWIVWKYCGADEGNEKIHRMYDQCGADGKAMITTKAMVGYLVLRLRIFRKLYIINLLNGNIHVIVQDNLLVYTLI